MTEAADAFAPAASLSAPFNRWSGGLEFRRIPRVEEAAYDIVRTGDTVALAVAGVAGIERRILIEQVIDAEYEATRLQSSNLWQRIGDADVVIPDVWSDFGNSGRVLDILGVPMEGNGIQVIVEAQRSPPVRVD